MNTSERIKIIAKDLLEKSEVALMSLEVEKQNQIIKKYEERITNLEKRMATYIDVTMALAKEVKTHLIIRNMKRENGKHGRSDAEVALRWQQWRAEYASGASVAQIANRWGMDRATVEYARKRDWKHKGDREIKGMLVA